MARTYSIVLFGATGFTGKLVAKYLMTACPPGLKWALAGRDEGRLLEVKRLIGSSCDVIAVGEADPAKLAAMCASTRVVISTAGPFAKYGEPLVAACVEAGTDYCDITGETYWAARMASLYEAKAQAKGAILVSFSGFDSVPADLGTFFVSKYVRSTHGVPVPEVMSVMSGSGGASGGTVATFVTGLQTPGALSQQADPFTYFPGHVAGSPPTAEEETIVAPLPDHVTPFWVPELDKYATYFPMCSINSRVVRRSAGIFAQRGQLLEAASNAAAKESTLTPLGGSYAYSPSAPFRYSEYMGTGSWGKAMVQSGVSAAVPVIAQLPGVLSLASRWLPAPGTGPTEEQRAKSSYTYTVIARLDGGKRVVCALKGHDAGYDDTSKMLAQAAFALVQDRAKLPGVALGGGFLTPATAFGSVLVDRLRKHDIITFDIVRDDLAAGGGCE